MYTCRWFVLCETVIYDSGTNNLTLVNTLSEVSSPTFPSLFPKFGFAARMERHDATTGPLSLRLVRSKESEPEVLLTVSRPTIPERAQFFLNFPAGVRLFAPGVIEFRIEAKEGDADWYVVASQTLDVRSVDAPTADTHAATPVDGPASS